MFVPLLKITACCSWQQETHFTKLNSLDNPPKTAPARQTPKLRNSVRGSFSESVYRGRPLDFCSTKKNCVP